jgi:hypothetical protein
MRHPKTGQRLKADLDSLLVTSLLLTALFPFQLFALVLPRYNGPASLSGSPFGGKKGWFLSNWEKLPVPYICI